MSMKYARYLKLAAAKRQWASLIAQDQVDISSDDIGRSIAMQDYDFDASSPEGERWSIEDYLFAREQCVEAVRGIGHIGSDKGKQAAWDEEISKVIIQAFPFSRYEGMRVDTWRYVAIKLLPDLTANRIRLDGDLHGQLFGRVDRNLFGRLWLRADFESQQPGVLKHFKEDNLTGLFERPSLVANSSVGLAVASAVDAFYENGLGPNNKESLIRDFYKRVVRIMAVRNFDAMPHDVLRAAVDHEATQSLISVANLPTL